MFREVREASRDEDDEGREGDEPYRCLSEGDPQKGAQAGTLHFQTFLNFFWIKGLVLFFGVLGSIQFSRGCLVFQTIVLSID